MPRPPRPRIENGLYHVTTRGNRRERIFLTRTDGLAFLAILGRVTKRYDWICHHYCLMPNHYHLLIETPRANVDKAMHGLNSGYARWFNAEHDKTGHLFERRYYSVVVESDSHLLELVRYIALNPVRARLCERAEAWRWSSYPALLGLSADDSFLTTSWILGLFGEDLSRARAGVRAFVEDISYEFDTFVD
jgi:putative transposase